VTDRYPPLTQWLDHATERAAFLHHIIPKHSVGAELGVYCGDFTQVILDTVQPAKLHLIDMWHLLGEHGWERWNIHGPTTREALAIVQACYAPQIDAGQVEIHVADDLELLPTFDDDYFDWCYIDTSHTYEHCAKELPLVATKVKPGGVICGDDWTGDPDHPHHGVYVAVHEFLERNPSYDLIYSADREDGQWAIQQR
jgi:SAM-dependent methyltransferase